MITSVDSHLTEPHSRLIEKGSQPFHAAIVEDQNELIGADEAMSVILHLTGAEAMATSLLVVAAAGAVYLGRDWLSE